MLSGAWYLQIFEINTKHTSYLKYFAYPTNGNVISPVAPEIIEECMPERAAIRATCQFWTDSRTDQCRPEIAPQRGQRKGHRSLFASAHHKPTNPLCALRCSVCRAEMLLTLLTAGLAAIRQTPTVQAHSFLQRKHCRPGISQSYWHTDQHVLHHMGPTQKSTRGSWLSWQAACL